MMAMPWRNYRPMIEAARRDLIVAVRSSGPLGRVSAKFLESNSPIARANRAERRLLLDLKASKLTDVELVVI